MNKTRSVSYTFSVCLLCVLAITGIGCRSNGPGEFKTHVAIKGTQWYFNGQVVNPGSPAEGLLMNVRMVNAVFEDRGDQITKHQAGFDPEANAEAFMAKIPEYVASGVNAFTLCLQGGMPGYEGAVNTAYEADGSLREPYMQRVEKVIRACDAANAAVILSCFYQRQHSHDSALTGRDAITSALKNTVNWLAAKKFTNVVLEVSNEYRHGGYRNWPDGEWLMSEQGQAELIRLAKQLNPELLVSTSGMGGGTFPEPLPLESDFLLIHFNNTSLDDIPAKVNELKSYGKPIVCNEDDKLAEEGAIALALSVANGAGWGFMNSPVNQRIPFEFYGTADDPAVYEMFRNVATPGYRMDTESMKVTTITIIYPNDGNIFSLGQEVEIRLSHVYPDKSVKSTIHILANDEEVSAGNRLIVNWKPSEAGTYYLQAVVKDESGKELYRSARADIIVKPE